VTFDHALGREMCFDPVADSEDVAVVPEPLGTLGAKTEAFETKADAGLTMVVLVGLFITFFAANSARVTTTLSAHGTLALGRSGLLRGLGSYRHRSMRQGSKKERTEIRGR